MAKKRTKSRERKRAVSKKKTTTKKQTVKPFKIFIYALALAALGGGGYLVYDRMKRKKQNEQNDDGADQDTIIINNNLPASFASSSTRSGSSGANNFPLKRGSRGSRVTALQQALAKIIGSAAMNANGGIDGQFGSGTTNALKMAGYPEVIDEVTFNKLTGNSGQTLQVVFNPSDIALKLYRAAQSKNIDGVLIQLRLIKSVADYSSVNEYYKKQGFISKTIVTDLLDFAFKASEASKERIRNEFQRIGLKSDDSGRWSLQGVPLFKDLITLRETFVIDAQSNRIPVRRNTILGDEIRNQNGMTWFKSIDNSILKVPTQDIKYTN
jgi:hypothetical protein